MTDIGESIAEPMLPGVVIGVVGMSMMLLTYPLYKKCLSARRRKYADKIIALSDKILEE